MARVPNPTSGLLFRYGYVWLEDYLRGKIDPTKERPACIVAHVAQSGDANLKIAGGRSLQPGDVIVLPITRSPPRSDSIAVELTVDDKRASGLDPEEPSWVVVSEFIVDIWPNADLSLIPGTERFDYGMAPPD